MFYIFLADGFEEIEALCPYDLLLRAGVEVKTVSINETTEVTGAHNIKIYADITVGSPEFQLTSLEGVMLPGGMPGASNLSKSKYVISALNEASKKEALICAICAAPFVLGENGILKGKNATCFPGFEDKLTGAQILEDKVVKDGNIITAKGMGCAFDFGIEIISALRGKEITSELKKSTMA